MPGLFGNFGNRIGGMFSNFDPNMAVTMAGLGMLSGSNPQEGFKNAMYGIASGREMDLDRRDRKKKREEEDRRRMMLGPALDSAGLDPAIRGYAEADPEFARSYLASSLGPTDHPSSYDEFSLAESNPAYGEFLKNSNRGDTFNIGPQGIDYGSPPTDTAWVRGPDGTVMLDDRGVPMALPIQGSKAWNELQAANEKGATADANAARTNDIVVQDIDRALTAIEKNPNLTAGLGAQVTSGIGGTPGANVAALIDTVGANVSFDKLQAMRQASPTGGALGSITERELQLLQSTMGALSQSQDANQLKENLRRLKNVYLDIIHGEGKGPPRDNGSGPTIPLPSGGTIQQLSPNRGRWIPPTAPRT